MEYCDAKDLLCLSETCVTFKHVLSNNTKLMSKWCLVMTISDLKDRRTGSFDTEKFKSILACLQERKFTKVSIRQGSDSSEEFDSLFDSHLVDADKSFGKIEELTVRGIKASSKRFGVIFKTLLTNVKKCHLQGLLLKGSITPTWIISNNLVDITFEDCGQKLFNLFLSSIKCMNLKKLSILSISRGAKSYTPTIQQNVDFKLEKLEIISQYLSIDQSFNEFLSGQTDLQELSLSCIYVSINNTLLQVQPNTKINMATNKFKVDVDQKDYFWTSEFVNMSDISHCQLSKCRFWLTGRSVHMNNSSINWVYSPEAPEDMRAFEDNILAFLDSSTDIPGLKHSQVIGFVMIGHPSWLETQATVSLQFIRDFIAALPNLNSLTIVSASTKEDILEVVLATGRNFEYLYISGVNGDLLNPQ